MNNLPQDIPVCRFCGDNLRPPFKVCPSCSSNQSIIGSLLKWGTIAGSIGSIIFLITWVFSIINIPDKTPYIEITHSNIGPVFSIENTGKRQDELLSVEMNISLRNQAGRDNRSLMKSFYEYSFPTSLQKVIDPQTFSEIKVIPPQSNQNILVTVDSKKVKNLDNFCTEVGNLKLASKPTQEDSCSVSFIFKDSINNNTQPFPCTGPYIRNITQRVQAGFQMCSQIKFLEDAKSRTTKAQDAKQLSIQIEQLKKQTQEIIGIE